MSWAFLDMVTSLVFLEARFQNQKISGIISN